MARYALEASSGLTEGGVAPCAKHFPGHGDTHVDSHLALPVINKTERELYETELVPFRALIEAGVATVMTGHMALPFVVTEDDKEAPSSCSKTVTTELLRHRLGFKGVIVTDCLEMEAVAGKYTSQKGAVLSLQAGADVAMICHTMRVQTGAMEETYRAVATGALSLAALRESGRRIGELKRRFAGTWEMVLAELDETRLANIAEANTELSRRAYKASTRIIRGPLPAVKEGPVLVLTPSGDPQYFAFAEHVRAHRTETQQVLYSPLPGPVVVLRQGLALLIFVTRNADRSTWQLAYLRRLREHIPQDTAVVVLASRGPYDLEDASDIGYGCVGSMEDTEPALYAAAGVIMRSRVIE